MTTNNNATILKLLTTSNKQAIDQLNTPDSNESRIITSTQLYPHSVIILDSWDHTLHKLEKYK